MMKITRIISLLLSLILVLSLCCVNVSAGRAGLEFGGDGKFTILQITDPQDDRYPAHDLEGFIASALQIAQPDLVIFTGDIVEDSRLFDPGKDDDGWHEGVYVEGKDGEIDYAATLENVKIAVDAVFAPVEEAGIPFAVTQGNNDYKSGISNEDWLEIYASYPHCITVDQSDDEAGKIDSYVKVYKSSSGEVGYGLWLLDNGRSFTDGQAQWFDSVETSGEPSLVFEHIPVDDIGNLYEECEIWDGGAVLSSGKAYRLNADIANGRYYTVYTPGKTSEQFTAWKEKGVKGAFFGHVHCDGYTGEWDGITMGLTYGCEFAKAGPYGFRTIVLDEDGTFDTELFTYKSGTVSQQGDVPQPVYGNKLVGVIMNFAALMKFVAEVVKSYLNIG